MMGLDEREEIKKKKRKRKKPYLSDGSQYTSKSRQMACR